MTDRPYEPCDNCPFRTDDQAIQLSKNRKKGIADSILGDSGFSCHKTTTFDDDGNYQRTSKDRPCVGAGRFIAANRGDVRANLSFRIEVMRGVLDPDRIEGGTLPTETDYDRFTENS